MPTLKKDSEPAYRRLNVNLNERSANLLRSATRELGGITYTEAVKRGVELLAFVHDTQKEGYEIQVCDYEKQRTRNVVFLV